jgi:hypothetical protein
VLNITTKNPDMASQIITDSLVLSNQTVNEQVGTTFQRRREEKARKNKYAIEDQDLRKQRVFVAYEMDTAVKLALLGEHALIARELDLSDGSFSAQSYSNASTIVASVGKDNPIYLRGYLAIEKEINMILTRQSANPFISVLTSIEDIKLQVLHDKTVTRADEVLASTPLGTEQFSAAVYDLASVAYTSKTKSALVLTLDVVLGGMLGIFVLLIRNALIKKDEAGLN